MGKTEVGMSGNGSKLKCGAASCVQLMWHIFWAVDWEVRFGDLAMLSALLRSSSRRAWRLSRPILATLDGAKVYKSQATRNVQFFSSSVVGGEGLTSATSLPGKDGRNSAYETEILGALRAYKEINGDLLVPQSFIVPTGESRWPSELWGYRLGAAVNRLRTRAAKKKLPARFDAQLKEMDFVYNVISFRWHEIIMPALRHYFKVYGNSDVSKDFVVPSGDDAWPRLAWGWTLGTTVDSIRNKKLYLQQVRESEEELKELKFCYETSLAERDWGEQILPALRVYREEFHDCLVEVSFEVPSELPWPKEAWGLRLGKVVDGIRTGKNYAEQTTRDKEILTELGFSWDFYESQWREQVFPALQVCSAEFGHFRLPQKFVVPRRDPWPKNTWGMPLGTVLYMMRYEGTFFPNIGRDVDRLEALGFKLELTERAWEKRVVPLLETYAKVFGDTAVPHDFVIPSESPWPKRMWGAHLGILDRICNFSQAKDAEQIEKRE